MNTNSVYNEPTSDEIKNILHKLALWKLQRKSPYKVNVNNYPIKEDNYPHLSFLYKILYVTDKNGSFTPEKVAEAKEFIEYWKSMNAPLL